MFLLVDNYDSFTWNIYHSIAKKGVQVIVERNDKVNLKKLSDVSLKGIIFSPGPGHPKRPGRSKMGRQGSFPNV